MSSWISMSSDLPQSETDDQDGNHDVSTGASQKLKTDWLAEYRTRLLSIASQIQELRGQTQIAKWEGNIRGKWPIEEYEVLVESSWEMLAALAQLGGALIQFDPLRKQALNQRARVLNPNFVSTNGFYHTPVS
jgi:hypothetical protein